MRTISLYAKNKIYKRRDHFNRQEITLVVWSYNVGCFPIIYLGVPVSVTISRDLKTSCFMFV